MVGEHIYCQEKCLVEKIAHICGNYTAESYTAEKIYCRNYTAEKIYCWKLYSWKLYCWKIILLKKLYCWKLYCSTKLYGWKLYCWKLYTAEKTYTAQSYTYEKDYTAENKTKKYLLKEIIQFNIYALTKAPQWLISFQSFTNFSSSKTNFELPSSCFIRISCTSSNIHHVNLPTTLRGFCLCESCNALFNLMMFAD